MPREARVHCRGIESHPGEGLPGLKGGTSLASARLPSFGAGRLRGPIFQFFFNFWDQLFANQNSLKIGPRMKPAQIRKIRPMGAQRLIFIPFPMTFGIPFGIIFLIFSQTAKSLFLNNSIVL